MIKHRITLCAFLIFLPACTPPTPDQARAVQEAISTPTQSTNRPESMHLAARANDIAGLQALWEADHPLNILDEAGLTPLQVAIEAQHPKAVEWLLSYQADPYGAKSTQDTPLSQAVLIASQYERHSEEQKVAFEILTLLIEHGVDPMEDYNGAISPLQLAMAKDCEACIEHIMEIVRNKNN